MKTAQLKYDLCYKELYCGCRELQKVAFRLHNSSLCPVLLALQQLVCYPIDGKWLVFQKGSE